jgi:hypothetical protein
LSDRIGAAGRHRDPGIAKAVCAAFHDGQVDEVLADVYSGDRAPAADAVAEDPGR